MAEKINSKTYLYTFLTGIFIQACTIIQGVLTARFLGVEGRGELAAVILWPTIFAGVGIWGVNIVIAQSPASRRQVMSLSLLTSLVSGAVCYIALPFLLPSGNNLLVTLAQLYSFYILINHFSINMIALMQFEADFKAINITRVLINLSIVCGLLLLWLFSSVSVQSVSILYLASNAVVLAYCFYWQGGKIEEQESTVEKLRKSIPYGFTRLSHEGLQHLDKVLLLWLLGEAQLGVWVVALTASGVLNMLFGAVGLVNFSKAVSCSKDESSLWLTKSFRMCLVFNIVLGVMLALVLPILLPFIYGGDYRGAVIVAQILIVGQAFLGATNMLNQVLVAHKLPFISVVIKVVSIVIIIFCGFLMRNKLTLINFAVIFSLAQMVGLIILLAYFCRKYSLISSKDFFPKREDLKLLVTRFKSLVRRPT